jgi:hypothetical protein
MNVHTSASSIDFHGDASLADLVAALEPHDLKPLLLEYSGRLVRPGYHVTEVKAASFSTLDCGANPDHWQETILQIEDSGPDGDGHGEYMAVGKLRGILRQVAAKIPVDAGARVTIEIGPSGEPMRIFDISTIVPSGDRLLIKLAGRSAICKPRHRSGRQAGAASCCAPDAKRHACCT